MIGLLEISKDGWDFLDSVHLEAGRHPAQSRRFCALEAVSHLAGEVHTDWPRCVCPVIARIIFTFNDVLLDEDRDRVLKPLIPLIMGTNHSLFAQEKRIYKYLDYDIRSYIPQKIPVLTNTDEFLLEIADKLVSLPVIDSKEQIYRIIPDIEKIHDDLIQFNNLHHYAMTLRSINRVKSMCNEAINAQIKNTLMMFCEKDGPIQDRYNVEGVVNLIHSLVAMPV